MKLKYLIICFFIVSMISYSQDKRETDNSITSKTADIYSYTDQISNFLQLEQVNQDNTNTSSRTLNSFSNNNISIEQIGFDNVVISNTVSTNSSLTYLQEGNENTIESINNITTISENITQKGNNNRVTNFSFGNVDTTNLNIIQEGNNLIFNKFGTNALTNDLQFKFQGSDQIITIRSF